MATERLTLEKQETQATTNDTISQEEQERINRELAELTETDGVCPECYANVRCDCL
jgi:hypothetical protein|tara:strand:+ start:1116 stop:1283 length:168 start_codon:yes stop_codon:yes gene_type:complete